MPSYTKPEERALTYGYCAAYYEHALHIQFPGIEWMPFLNVLLVEDSIVLTERLTEAIQRIGAVRLIGAVGTEVEAVAIAGSESVDVIVLDLHLHQGTGFGVMRQLRFLHLHPCIIVLTNYDLPEYKEAAVSLGATHFLDKARGYFRLSELLQGMCDADIP